MKSDGVTTSAVLVNISQNGIWDFSRILMFGTLKS